jgi:hypothetical protein
MVLVECALKTVPTLFHAFTVNVCDPFGSASEVARLPVVVENLT